MKVKSLSRVRVFATPGTAAYQAPPSMGFSRQEYWSGVPLPSLLLALLLNIILEVLATEISNGHIADIFYIANIFVFIVSSNGNPLQYSCLANPMDGGAR